MLVLPERGGREDTSDVDGGDRQEVAQEAQPDYTPRHPVDLYVEMSPQDAEADTPRQAAARDREAERKAQHDRARLKRAERIRAIQEREGCDEAAAIGLWQDEVGMSYWTGKRALEFVDGSGNGAGTASP